MMYLPCASEFYFERLPNGFYRVVADNLMTYSHQDSVDSAIEVLAGDQFDDSEEVL